MGIFAPSLKSLHRSTLSGALRCLSGYHLIPRVASVGRDAAPVDANVESVSVGNVLAGAGIISFDPDTSVSNLTGGSTDWKV